jgi:TolB-like protein/Tfp pilus assembly protein PilF
MNNLSSRWGSGFTLGPWRVEPTRNTLIQGDREVHLENRLMQTLVFLAEHQGRAVSREQFFNTVWKGLVVNEEALSRAISLLRTALNDNAHRPKYIQTIPGAGYRLIAEVVRTENRRAKPQVSGSHENSIAVLPFVNLSDDSGNEYFSDGVSEEILNVLAKVERFKVVARTSSFAFKDRNEDLREIGKALDVTHVLEGSVRKAGSRVRITAQLIKAQDGYHLWSETFDRELDDIFAVQDEIAAAVAAQLRLTLLPAKSKAIEVNPEAYTLLLQARYLDRQSTPEAFAKGLELCKQALAIDPDYAEVWQGMASIYCHYAGKGHFPPAEGGRLATIAANKALELDQDYASAHTTLGWIAVHFNWDMKEAAKHFQGALALAPNDLELISSSANIARSLGQLDTAIAMQQFVNERDPLNPTGHTYLGFFYRCAGQYEAAISSYRNALSLSPDILSAHYNIGMVRLLQGRLEEALSETMLENAFGYRVMGLAPIYHAMGKARESDAAINDMIEHYAIEGAYNIGFIFAYREEPDLAFKWLEIALENQDAGLTQITTEPLIANLHSDPRWQPFLERIGMSDDQLSAIKFEFPLPVWL